MNEQIEFQRVDALMGDADFGRSIFVFGSNCMGVHGAGAARTAWHKYGAVTGQGEGLQGNSYAIPTRTFINGKIVTLHIDDINLSVKRFLDFALANPYLDFILTRVGCGYAGHTDDEIAPLFALGQNMSNIYLPLAWREIYWKQRSGYPNGC
jgi:hypothetical protein